MFDKFVFIRGNTPSSKNSKVWTGRFLVNSKPAQKYIKSTKDQWVTQKVPFLIQLQNKEKPYHIGMYFVRDSKRKADYNNCSQIVCDLMKANKWIEDDNMYEMIPVFLGFHIDKENPGVYLIAMDKQYDELLKECLGLNISNGNSITENIYTEIKIVPSSPRRIKEK